MTPTKQEATVTRSVLVTVQVRIHLDENYDGEVPNDVEMDLQYDLAEGHIRDDFSTLEVLNVVAGPIDES